jgi:ASC-1-like (ASCH) protein
MTVIHYLNFNNPPDCDLYDAIRNSQKIVDGRKNSPKNQQIQEGDVIHFSNDDKKRILKCKVRFVNKYHTINEFVEKETVENTTPCAGDIDSAISIYQQYVSGAEIKKLNEEFGHGFLGIGIEFIQEEKSYHSHLGEPHFSDIKNGTKTVEGRLNKGKFRVMSIGDTIIFHNKSTDEIIKVIVTKKTVYNTFKEMLESEGLDIVLPRQLVIEDGVNVYRQFFTEEQEKGHGVVAIGLKTIIEKKQDGGNFKQKYLKYKTKYLKLKAQIL